MALESDGVDSGAVSTILNRLKSQGIFDQFRRDCLADVDTKPAYQNLRQRVESYVSNFLSRFTWTPDMNKNQLRDRLRRQINQSDMLASGVDRIIEQVVEPKMQHIFRPQIEKVVNQYLHSKTFNGEEDIIKKNGTLLLNDHPSINTIEVPPMTPPDETIFNMSPDIPSPPPEQPPLPPTPAIDDDEKMPPPPQPPPPPLPPSSEELTIDIEDPVILPSPAFEPIGSSPPHPGASFLNKEFVDSPVPEPLSDGSPEQMDFSPSPDSFKSNSAADPLDIRSLLAKAVFGKKGGRSFEGDVTSPQTSDASPLSDGRPSSTNERKSDTKQTSLKKGMKSAERNHSSSPKSKAKTGVDSQKAASEASSPGTWSTKSSTSLSKVGKKDKLEESPGSLSTPSTPEKTVQSEYERKLEIKRKVENLIKQNIKIGDKRDSSDSSGGDSSPDNRYRGDSEHRRTPVMPSPDRHRKDYRSPEKKQRNKKSWEQMQVRLEDALSPEVISDEELEKKSVKYVSDAERSEGELVSSDEDGKKEKELTDLGNLSDITVSSVHTSDLSSFSDVSSSSSTSGSDNEGGERKTKESSGPTTNLKSIPKQYQSKPTGFPPHFDSSEDEATREDRKKKVAVAKEERVRRRQLQKEEKEKLLRIAKSREREIQKIEEKPAETSKIDDALSPDDVSTDTDSSKEMGDSPEQVKEANIEAKPVTKRRRSSEEEKPPVEFFPSYVTSTSKRKRRQASVKDSYLLTQRVSGGKLLKRRKKKLNNRSGSKLFFRMGGQSGSSTPKRSASPRMGGPSISQPEGHLVSKAIAKLEETQDVSYASTKASTIQGESGKYQRDAEIGRAEIIPVLNQFASFVAGTPKAATGVASEPRMDERQTLLTGDQGGSNYVAGGGSQNAVVEERTSPSEHNVTEICSGQERAALIGSRMEIDKEVAERDCASVEQDIPGDDSSSGPATPLMDETEEELSIAKSEEAERRSSGEVEETEEMINRVESKQGEEEISEDDISQSGEETNEERSSVAAEENQQEGGTDVSEGTIGTLESKDRVTNSSQSDVTEVIVKEGESSTNYGGEVNENGGEVNETSERGSEVSLPMEASLETVEVTETEVQTDICASSYSVDEGRKETSENLQTDEREVTIGSENSEDNNTRAAIQEQTCKVILHDIQLQPETRGWVQSLQASEVEEEREVTVGLEESEVKCSWVEEVGDGIVSVHDEAATEEVEDDSPPTPTQDELIDIVDGEELVEATMEEEDQQEETVDEVSLEDCGVTSDYQERISTEQMMATAEEQMETESLQSSRGEASVDVASMIYQADSIPTSEVTVGRRSRRSVSDRHSKDEDFIYFGIRRKSRQKSQSPTPSLQSNESESSRSSRSSRRNSGRSVDMEEKRPDVIASRKRHASQELPSTSVGEDRPRRARRGSPPNRYSPSESATQRIPKRRQSPPPPTPQSQEAPPSRKTPKREHYTRHLTSSNRDSDFVYEMPKRRSDRHSVEERPPKRKR